MEAADLERLGGSHAGRDAETRLELSAVDRAIARLPEDQRTVLLLIAVDGCTYREAADILNVPIGTVMSRLARARLALGRRLEDAGTAGAEM